MVAAVAAAVAAGMSFVVREEPPAPVVPTCEWLAGDLDVQTVYSAAKLTDTSLSEVRTFALTIGEQAEIARQRGLDFIAIADLEDVGPQSDPEYGSDGLIWVDGYEHTFGGFAQLLGTEERFPRNRRQPEFVRRVQRSLNADGGILQVAHPGDRYWPRAYGTELAPDAVEVWVNGPWSYDVERGRKDPAFSMSFYDRLLDRGQQVAATAGSSNMERATSKLTGVGQPTTWACVEERSEQGILDAVARGRTTVSHEYPAQGPLADGEGSTSADTSGVDSGTGGFRNVPPEDTDVAFISIEGDAGDGELEALVGDVVAPGDRIRIGVFDAPFSVLRIVGDGSRVIDQVEVFEPTFVHELKAPQGNTWLRAEVFARPEDTIGGPCRLPRSEATYCGNRLGMLALSSPIYISTENERTPR